MSMTMMKHGALVLALAGGFAAATVAKAATVTFTGDLIGSGNTRTASVQKFDTSLGSLNFVRIAYDITSTLRIRYENTSFSTATATVDPNTLLIRGHRPNGIIFTEDQSLANAEFGGDFAIAAARQIGSIKINGRRTLEFPVSTQRSFDSRGTTIGSITFNNFNKNTYAGSGNFAFNFSTETLTPLTFSGLLPSTGFLGGPQDLTPFLEGTVSVTYDFTEPVVAAPVPVPASLPLMALGLAGFGVLSRRRRAKI